MKLRQPLLLSVALLPVLAACATSADPKTGLYAKPIGGAPATVNDTAYSSALRCLTQNAGQTPPRVAVGAISDLTGKRDIETGAKVTQGAALFAMTALNKAGVPIVERFDRGISDVEIAYARDRVLSDNPQQAGTVADNARPIYAGQIAGSDYYIVGGITELNYNISSSGLDARGGDVGTAGLKASLTTGKFVINVAIDLRLIDTRSQEVVDITSYQKQIVGREIKAGVFDFLNGNVFDISGGKSALEPIQLAVRTLVERSVYDFAASLHQQPYEQCMGDEAKASRALQAKRSNKSSAVAAAPSRAVSTPPPAKAAPEGPAYGGPYLDRSRWLPKS
ncbi:MULTISPECIES: holdfast anchoring protein HfaB [unclassified Caulobacter]|uniref:holdfast anchoring protein HfaB n=1 Tax=unclassified Caulobacter TaxID=2648921 RepID=UPI0007848953|nr:MULTISPECIES: holdfast anchoring protein HfaB [unclassified Caulobacter]AZS22105.1 curli assembly protein CsgG [Caulobacter sp. FWC26]